MTQRGGIVSGVVADAPAPVARTVARERVAVTTLAAYAESDRLYPLGDGRMLAVFSWRGPAPNTEDTPAADRRVELRVLVPADPPSYFQDKDLRPDHGEPIPQLEPCTGATREERDACAYPLPARVLESEVNVDEAGQPREPREVSCLERDAEGNLVAGCDENELRTRWEDGQFDALSKPSAGSVDVRCQSPVVRRQAVDDNDKAVELFFGGAARRCSTSVGQAARSVQRGA